MNNHEPHPIVNKPVAKTWKIISIAGVVALFLILLILIAQIMAVRSWVNNISQHYLESQSGVVDKNLLNDTTFIRLHRTIAFTKARLQMSVNDSIGLTVNLADSSIHLDIMGVTVHNSPIHSIRVNRSIRSLHPFVQAQWLSKAARIHHSVATIPKEPIMVKIAPRDTIEAAQPDITPDTSTATPVFFVLHLDNGMRMMFLQDDLRNFSQRWQKFVFMQKIKVTDIGKLMAAFIRGRKPAFKPMVKISVSGTDARSIYRAIPVHGRVAINL